MNPASRVVIAMSGGVDSSVAAALLLQQGYEVIGMMLRLWSEPGRAESNRCCSPDAMALARRVAAQLGIPFYAIDAQEIFHNTVVNYFVEGYARGATPNPCLICNRHVRWNFLLNHALALGADYLATGHYARLLADTAGRIQLLRAPDSHKDQSYVLHVLTQEQLMHALFPIGEYTKDQVRNFARQYHLPIAERRDSQDLCFLAGDDYRQFLIRNAPNILQPGPIETVDGETIGYHQGLPFYTIGQRKGLGISSAYPMYVLKKEEGGRHTPFFGNYRPQFYFRTTDVTGIVELPSGVEMVMPGDDVDLTIELITPIAMEEELRFAIREGGKTVGAGVVTKIIE